MKAFAQIDRVEPPNWWTGFQDQTLQLLIKGDGISEREVELDYPGVELVKVHKAESPNYLFVDLKLTQGVKSGKFDLHFTAKGKKTSLLCLRQLSHPPTRYGCYAILARFSCRLYA